MLLRSSLALVFLLLACPVSPAQDAASPTTHRRPNIVWLSAEDISAHLGCYGDPNAITPHLDQLATQGTRYTHAFTTAGVCAPCRSGIITGMYQTTLGSQHMRCTATLPEQIQPFPVLLRQAGYYCTNRSKQDYQFKTPKETWDVSSRKAHWRTRPDPSQPFFAVFNFTGCHESGIASDSKYREVTRVLKESQRQDASQLSLPPYYPDSPIVREHWKRNYELITAMDHWAGDLIQQLKDDGLYDNTIILFWSDHGVGLPRAKRWLYDSGTHIPLIVRMPQAYRTDLQGQPGSVSDQLISSIDFGPTVLNLAGIKRPQHMQGQAFLGDQLSPPRQYVYGARDRMDERYDIIRSVRDKRYRYIRNYEPLKSYYQYINTCEKGAIMNQMRARFDAGNLTGVPASYFADTKPVEELYDCQADPHQIHNLADDPTLQDVLQRMRQAQGQWARDTRDLGLIPEPIIQNRAKLLGSDYSIMRQPGAEEFVRQLEHVAVAASAGKSALPQLIDATKHEDSAIRYWAATGIGNLGLESGQQGLAAASELLGDSESAVRTAAARALCRMNRTKPALPVLIQELKTGNQWERLHAAIVLDEIDEQALPVIEQMRAGLEYQKGFNSDGKYRVRVTNRALNELEGTRNDVP